MAFTILLFNCHASVATSHTADKLKSKIKKCITDVKLKTLASYDKAKVFRSLMELIRIPVLPLQLSVMFLHFVASGYIQILDQSGNS